MENLENQIMQVPKSIIKRWLIFLVSFCTLLVVAAAVGVAYVWYQIYVPVDSANAQTSKFLVEQGNGVKAISAALRRENYIRSEFWFETYVWYKKQQANLQAGQYALSPAMNIPEILQTITGGKVIPNEVQITFPEGFTLEQIKQRLFEGGVEAAGDIDQEKIDGFDVQYKFFNSISSENSLEGFLFPDTYRFKKDIKKARS